VLDDAYMSVNSVNLQ